MPEQFVSAPKSGANQITPAPKRELQEIWQHIDRLRRFKRSASGYPSIRPDDCQRVIAALRQYVTDHKTEIGRWETNYTDELLQGLDELASGELSAYPSELIRLSILRAEIFLLLERPLDAIKVLKPLATKPYMVEGDFSLVERNFELDLSAHLSAGQFAAINPVLFERLRYLIRWRPYRALRLFYKFHSALAFGPAPSDYAIAATVRRHAQSMLESRIESPGNRIKRSYFKTKYVLSWFIGSLLLAVMSHVPKRLLRRWRLKRVKPLKITRRVYREVVRLLPHNRRRKRAEALETAMRFRNEIQTGVPSDGPKHTPPPTKKDHLITRAMGGIGDIIMMTPGLHARALKLGRPVYFATKKQFFPLIENDPAIHLLDIESSIDTGLFRKWTDLSICPAASYESRQRPHVRRGRVELFARKMGVTKAELQLYGTQPRCLLSNTQKAAKDRFRAHYARNNLPLVAIQPLSRETYRNVPSLLAAIERLAKIATVAIFHTSPLDIPAHPNIHQFHAQPLRDTIAMIAACDYIVSVDSAFYHLGAAFGIPTLGIYGPTDGEIRSVHHPKYMLVPTPEPYPCAPCWRNEDTPCYLTKLPISACLNSIPADSIVESFRSLMEKYPVK